MTERRAPKRRRRFRAGLALAAMLAVPATGLMPPVPGAAAQERRATILDFIFGRPRQQERVYESYGDGSLFEPVMPAARPAPEKPRRAKPKPVPAALPEPEAVEKLETAKRVLVVGDFIAGGLGSGLQQAFAQTPGIVIEDRSDVASGLVRDDYFDWPNMLPVYADDLKPALIVVSLGANDRQQMKIGGAREKFRTEAWLADYTKRVSTFAALARSRDVPLLWVGMPAFQSAPMTADMVTLNGIFRAQTEKAGGQFIDIWDGFVDEAGKFVTTGSDVNGQQVRLRGTDGINLTSAGKRKLAFYVEKDIRRLLGETAAPGGEMPDASAMRDLLVTAPTSDTIIKTPPIGLVDPELDGAGELLDAAAMDRGNGKSARDLLVERGEVATAPAGRIDDFRLAKPETVISNPVIRN